MRLSGRGPAGFRGGANGTLFVHLGVVPDPRFERHGDDLHTVASVSLAQAVSRRHRPDRHLGGRRDDRRRTRDPARRRCCACASGASRTCADAVAATCSCTSPSRSRRSSTKSPSASCARSPSTAARRSPRPTPDCSRGCALDGERPCATAPTPRPRCSSRTSTVPRSTTATATTSTRVLRLQRRRARRRERRPRRVAHVPLRPRRRARAPRRGPRRARRATRSVAVWLPALKGDRAEWAVAKLTELGVDELGLLTCARASVRPDAAALDRVLARWRRVAREASCQSRRTRLPVVVGPRTVAEVVAAGRRAVRPRRGPRRRGGHDAPRRAARAAGARPSDAPRAGAVSLGATVLRTETAAVALVRRGRSLCAARHDAVREAQ